MLDISQKVNKLGKYLKKHIDGAYKIAFSPNMCDVYITVYYQEPGDPDSFKTLNFDISIVSYQGKIRVNVTTMDDVENTVAQFIYKPEKLEHMDEAVTQIYKDITNAIALEYEDYDFAF